MRLLQIQESVNPYMRVIVPTTAKEFDISRGFIVLDALSAAHDVVLADGTEMTLPQDFPEGVYPIAIKKVTCTCAMDINALY